MVDGDVDEETAVAGVDGVGEFGELFEWGGAAVEFGAGRVDGFEVEGGEGTAESAHAGVGGGDWEGREEEDDVEAHGAEDAVHVSGEGAERTGRGDGGPAVAVEGGDGCGVVGWLFRAEHADEGFVDGAAGGGPCWLDLDADVA